MHSETLIQSCVEQTRLILIQVEKLKSYPIQTLTWKESETSWSILECLEHLNLYGDFYLPEIEDKIKTSNSTTHVEFTTGVLGSYFAQSMLPKQKLRKMKTFKNKNPLHAKLDKTVIDQFIQQQTKLLDLLDLARQVHLGKVKIQTSISSWIKLKLGDTFRFYINHILRHLNQIERVETAMQKLEV